MQNINTEVWEEGRFCKYSCFCVSFCLGVNLPYWRDSWSQRGHSLQSLNRTVCSPHVCPPGQVCILPLTWRLMSWHRLIDSNTCHYKRDVKDKHSNAFKSVIFIGPSKISTDHYHAVVVSALCACVYKQDGFARMDSQGRHPLLLIWTRLTIIRQPMSAKPKLSSFILFLMHLI